VRSVLIYDQRSTAREALTHAITAAPSSVIHIGCVADASDLSTAFAGSPADLVLIGLQDATARTALAPSKRNGWISRRARSPTARRAARPAPPPAGPRPAGDPG